MRIVIAEDELPARNKLIRQLQSCNNAEVIGIASNGQEAVELLENLNPDVLLLDIEMPLLTQLNDYNKH